MERVVEFLTLLHENNDKAWFDAHKEMYKRALSRFEEFTAGLIDGIAAFDPSVRGLTVKDCTYRIYRDTRFSADKTPYKTHMGAFVAPHGKKGGYAGYYFHVEPAWDERSWSRGHLLITGLHCPQPEVLRSVREEIAENGAEFEASIREAEGFVLDESNKLKRLPRGYDADTPYAEWLKLKEVYVTERVSPDFMRDRNLLGNTLHEFRKTRHFADLLNRAVRFAHEEMR
ncbi:MAG: DUF2461 domain-containing protein [Alistipes sp.]|nr:DUF2461 domain-containing protein [Alistipes sp.]